MKTTAFVLVSALLLGGCAALEETYFIDREYGQAQMSSWDGQVAYPDYRYADKAPEGMFGITAENIMKVYNQTFAEKPQEVNIFQLDIQQ